jgi:TPP-dependent indolepyruvate ferredoxin oxidoreductase alpha subunit
VVGSTTVGTDDCATLARALTRWIDVFFTVTGQPVTDLIDQVGRITAQTEVSINEKTAVEAAVGLAAVGGRPASSSSTAGSPTHWTPRPMRQFTA